ncbi:MAG: DUF4258 domain-containing protein [Oligoflexales bacterium]
MKPSMDCKTVTFSGHAITQMFSRNISVDDVKAALRNGEAIESYPNDKPYPTWLLLGTVENRPLHVVMARNTLDANCIVVTAYEPSLSFWEPDFKTRQK